MRYLLQFSTASLLVLLTACGKQDAAVGSANSGSGTPAAAEGSGPLFVAQEGWVESPPSNSMRVAQFRLPGEAGDAEVVVFHFGEGSGGSVEENFTRWTEQFAPDESGVPLVPIRLQWERSDVTFHGLELAGEFSGGMGSAMGDNAAKPGQRMLATVLECGGGPYFVKLTGPDATVEAWRESYTKFLNDFRP